MNFRHTHTQRGGTGTPTSIAKGIVAALCIHSCLTQGGCSEGTTASINPEIVVPDTRVAPALDGVWFVSFDTRWFGEIRTRLRFDLDEQTGKVRASSRPGALGDMVGGLPALLVQIFASAFPDGALLRFSGRLTLDEKNAPRIDGVIPTPVGNAALSLTLHGDRMEGSLAEPWNNQWFGRVWGHHTPSASLDDPVAEYDALASLIHEHASRYIYSPRLLSNKEWARFFGSIGRRLPRARDDMEAIGAFMLEREHVEPKQVSLYRKSQAMIDAMNGVPLPGPDGQSQTNWSVRRLESGAILVEIREIPRNNDTWIDESFGALDALLAASPASMTWENPFPMITDPLGSQTTLSVALQNNPPIFLDLRESHGSSLSAAAKVSGRFLSDPLDIGFFATRTWWSMHEAHPSPANAESSRFVQADLARTGALKQAIIEAGSGEGVVIGRVLPAEPNRQLLENPLYILVGEETAQAAELLAATLQDAGRATVIGERTAGILIVTEELPLADTGWYCRVPTATFVLRGGTPINDIGIAPDVVVNAELAIAAAEAFHSVLSSSNASTAKR